MIISKCEFANKIHTKREGDQHESGDLMACKMEVRIGDQSRSRRDTDDTETTDFTPSVFHVLLYATGVLLARIFFIKHE
jgi:hypothetical protein